MSTWCHAGHLQHKGESDTIPQGDHYLNFRLFPPLGELKHPSSTRLPSSLGLFKAPFLLSEKFHQARGAHSTLPPTAPPWNRIWHHCSWPICFSSMSMFIPTACLRETTHSHRMGAVIQVWDEPSHQGPWNFTSLQYFTDFLPHAPSVSCFSHGQCAVKGEDTYPTPRKIKRN